MTPTLAAAVRIGTAAAGRRQFAGRSRPIERELGAIRSVLAHAAA